ncbi:prepilin-type N-terminal cleavage/methylation domain-containing protein [Massilia glaciei]|uniref:Prepilin-type N-terminal cleavage/methylation domain-containing protein n=2 Tax=Massilia glaciei TaxID=1524097 RepID=A0A2U2HJK1_9BURK|nr:prepilin-type N-terminal cleavage/methylation domain-containing protein [Massilia glaciei]
MPIRNRAQAGFTIIELIVVIVILGILAATALPRMFDMSTQARMAKMNAAVGSVKAASATAHAQWLVAGGKLGCAACGPAGAVVAPTLIAAEGTNVPTFGGYPDVGGDGAAQSATASGGIAAAANLDTNDYVVATNDPSITPIVPSTTTLWVSADAAHPKCVFTYTEATQSADVADTTPTVTAVPAIVQSAINETNC